MLAQVFQNQWRFRCLLLSFVHLMTQNKRMAETYQQTQVTRSSSLQTYINTLKLGGYLRSGEEMNNSFLVSVLSLVNRFWLSEAAISFRGKKPEEQMRHYLTVIVNLLQPYATPKGKGELSEFLKSL